MKKVITAQDISDARKSGLTCIALPPGCLVTPQAMDDARAYGITLQPGATQSPAGSVEPLPLAPLPGIPGRAVLPARPVGPVGPVQSVGPVHTAQPVRPMQPMQSMQSAQPVQSQGASGSAEQPRPASGIFCARETEALQKLLSAICGFGNEARSVQTAPPAHSVSASGQAPLHTSPTERMNAMSQQSGQAAYSAPGSDSFDLHAAVRAALAVRLGTGADTAALDRVITEVIASVTAPASATPGGASAPGNMSGDLSGGAGGALLARAPEEYSKSNGGARDAVLLTDALPADENGPGIGFMQFTDTSFAWTFPSDEVLVVQEGVLTLSSADGARLGAGAGEALRIPAGTPFTLTASGRVRCVYSAWPK